MAFILPLKPVIGCLANSMSPCGTDPVSFSSACNSTTRFSERSYWIRWRVLANRTRSSRSAFDLPCYRERRGRCLGRLAVQVLLDEVVDLRGALGGRAGVNSPTDQRRVSHGNRPPERVPRSGHASLV